MQQYQWGVEVTSEFLDGNGGVEQVQVEIRPANSEMEARARVEAITDAVADPSRNRPKYQRTVGARLFRRPIGEWEVTS